MSATVRSVDVRLNAMVSGYITDMRRAGRETDRAFARSQGNVQALNKDLGITRQRIDGIDTSGRAMNTTLARSNTRLRVMAEQSKAAGAGLADVRNQVGALNGSGSDSIVVLGRNSTRAGSEIDTMSGRLGIFLRLAGALGPALVPVGGAVVPVLAGLTAGLGAAAGAIGVTILAVNGLGDAMDALDEYQLEPTQANLEKLRAELDRIGPTAAHFVRYLDSIEPQLRSLQEAAREGVLPGWEAGIDAMLGRLPQVRRLVAAIANEVGLLSTQAGAELAGARWDAFFDYLRTDAAPTLRAFAQATGNVVLGVGNMLVAFAPLTRGFTGGLVEMTRAFADWSAGLDDNASFQGFLDYIRATGPQVLAFLGQFTLALAGIVEAAAPVGQVLLPILTGILRAIEIIADSDLGTPLMAGLAAISTIQLATMAWGKIAGSTIAGIVAGNARAAASYLTVTTATERATMSASALAAMERRRNTAALVGAGKFAAVLGGLAIAGTGAADGVGLTNTASMALMGSFAGPWGAAVGGAVGLTLDLAAANDNLETAIRGADDAIQTMDVTTLRDQLAALDEQMAAFDERTNVDFSWNPLEFSKQNLDAVIAGTSELISGTRESADAKREETATALEAAEANARYARQARIAGVNAGYTATEIRGMTDAMAEQRSEALAAFDAITAYGQAMADARQQAKKAAAGIDETTKGGRANREALSNLAAAWNNQSKAVTNNVSKWREARKNFIDTAVAMDVPIGKARDLADRLLEIPRQRVIDIEMRGGQESIDEMARIKRQAEDVAGQYRISFIVTQTNAFNKRQAEAVAGVSSDGGTVQGQRQPYGDKVLYGVAPGEEIISNRYGQADRNRAALKAANAGARIAVVGYADGGTGGGNVRDLAFPGQGRSLDSRLEIVTVMQQIAGLRRDLARDGKNALHGLNRQAAELQLKIAERDLRRAKLAEEREARQQARDIRSGVRSATEGFDLRGDMTVQDVRDEFRGFAEAVREAGGSLPRGFKRLRDQAVALAEQLGELTEDYEASSDALEDMRTAAYDFRDRVGKIFNNDIFAKGGLANARLQLRADSNDTQERTRLLQAITALGIDPESDAYRALAAEGDMQTLRDLDTATEVQEFVALFAERVMRQNVAGATAMGASFMPGLVQLAETTQAQQQQIAQLTAALERNQQEAANLVATATAQATGTAAYAGTMRGAEAGVRAGFAAREKKNNSKARTR